MRASQMDIDFQIEFELVSLQPQIPFNIRTKVQFKIRRTQNRSNPWNFELDIDFCNKILYNFVDLTKLSQFISLIIYYLDLLVNYY